MKSRSIPSLLITGLVAAASMFGEAAQAQHFNFVSFNTLRDGAAHDFEAYQHVVRPIMERHGGHYLSTDLVQVLAGHEQAQVVNIGTMGTPEQAGAFFADPEFQAAFPTLIPLLSDHLTWSAGGALPHSGELQSGDRILLVASDSHDVVQAINHDAATEMVGHWEIAASTRGLGPDTAQEHPPGTLFIWKVTGHHFNAHSVDGARVALLLDVR